MERPWRGGPWLLQEGGEEGLEVGEPRVIGSMLLLDWPAEGSLWNREVWRRNTDVDRFQDFR